LPALTLNGHRVKDGDHVLVALDGKHRLVRTTHGLGACLAISVLPIRGGKLRAQDRVNYDSGTRAMTLDQLREQLLNDVAADSTRAHLAD
jgi:hypothetical protein